MRYPDVKFVENNMLILPHLIRELGMRLPTTSLLRETIRTFATLPIVLNSFSSPL